LSNLSYLSLPAALRERYNHDPTVCGFVRPYVYGYISRMEMFELLAPQLALEKKSLTERLIKYAFHFPFLP